MIYPVGIPITYTADPETPGFSSASHAVVWSFDDSTTDTGLSVSKTWATPGMHTAVVTATNPTTLGVATAQKTVSTLNPMGDLALTASEHRVVYSGGKAWIALGNAATKRTYSITDGAASPTTLGVQTTSLYRSTNNSSSACVTSDGTYVAFAGHEGAPACNQIIIINTATNAITYYQVPTTTPFTGQSFWTSGQPPCLRPTLDGKIIVAFYNQSGPQGWTFTLNPATLTVATVNNSDTPQYASNMFAQVSNGDIYNLNTATYARKCAYGTNLWTNKSNANPHTYALNTGVIVNSDDTILMISGSNGAAPTNKVTHYNPATDVYTAKTVIGTARAWPLCVKLPGGKILVCGGSTDTTSANALDTGEVYDPVANTWTPTANTMSVARTLHDGCVVGSGNVMIVGGSNASGALKSIEFYNPTTNSFTPVDG